MPINIRHISTNDGQNQTHVCLVCEQKTRIGSLVHGVVNVAVLWQIFEELLEILGTCRSLFSSFTACKAQIWCLVQRGQSLDNKNTDSDDNSNTYIAPRANFFKLKFHKRNNNSGSSDQMHVVMSFLSLRLFIHVLVVFERCVSTQTERLSVPHGSASSIVLIWMLFQAKPGTGLDFRSPKFKSGEPDSSGRESGRRRNATQSKTNPNIRGLFRISPSYINSGVTGSWLATQGS